jgi:AcrR family transcriptional regulator
VRARQRDRRVRVIDAALEVIAERGLAATRMSDISRRAGMSSGHVLYYFKTKNAVLMEALGLVEQRVHEDAARDLPRVPAGPPRLRRLLELNLPSGLGDPRWMLWLEAWTLAPHDADIAALTSELDQRWVDLLATVIDEGRRAGAFSCQDVDDAAFRLSALFDGLAVQVVTGAKRQTAGGALRACMRAAAAELGFRNDDLDTGRTRRARIAKGT